MTNQNQEQVRFRGSQNDLDRMLDSALAKYTAVEPRTGLEKRVLANLRVERTRIADHAWWRRGLAVTMTAVVIVVVAVGLRSSKPSQPLVKNTPSVTTPNPLKPETRKPVTQMANRNENVLPPRREPIRHTVAHQTEAVVAAYPKLDQFPSPHPLSEQEEFLARYIVQDPQRAALVAEARMKVLRKDQEEEQREATDDGGDAQPIDTKSR
jgi:hypothetical protein